MDSDALDSLEFDFRLVEVSDELFTLEDHLDMIEQHLERLLESEGKELTENVIQLGPDDPKADYMVQRFYYTHGVIYPQFFWGSFLISLYAVYESAVIEIAKLIQKKSGLKIGVRDIKGTSFLDSSKKYYEYLLGLELCPNADVWRQIEVLSNLRNAYAHGNGRTDMLDEQKLGRIKRAAESDSNIVIGASHILVNALYVREAYECIKLSLLDLIKRYKAWDNSENSTSPIQS